MINKRKPFWKTGLSLLVIIAVCILLNIIGTNINSCLGLPFYIDCIGTILAAVLGGYIPCITVGFFTNIIASTTDSNTMYYCIISVLIAMSAVIFSKKMRKINIPYTLLAILVFALLGGLGGGTLTWLINGLSFGEGTTVDLASEINKFIPVGYLTSNLLANFLVDFADKAIVTFIALLIYKLLPKKLLFYVHHQSWYYIPVFEKTEKHNRNFMSLRFKTTLLIILSIMLVGFAAIGVCMAHYNNSTIAEYEEDGKYIGQMISETIDADKIDDYLREGRSSEGYTETEDFLAKVMSMSPKIKYVYVYRIEPDGTHVVFDIDTEELKANELGEVIEYDESIKKYKDKFLAGEEVPSDITNNDLDWVLSVYEPVKDSAGKTQCYIGVDMNMKHVRSDEFTFLAKIISLFIGFLILIRTYTVWIAEISIIKPLNSIAHVSHYSGLDTPEERKKWLNLLDALDIRTGDEIENLYLDYKTMAYNTVRYIEDTQRKSEQLTKIQNGLILVLATMVESRDQCTGDHVFKTAAYTNVILRQMEKEGIYADQLSEAYITEVVNCAPLHDVGKIVISDVILNKTGRLTDEEFFIMQSHTIEGGKIIDKAIVLVDDNSGYLNEAKNMVLYHHEKWNGKGYPYGLKEEEIPLSARVMAVADVFDALVSQRSYKKPFTIEKAMDIIREDAGTHFDPLVAKAFLDAEPEIRRIAALHMEP